MTSTDPNDDAPLSRLVGRRPRRGAAVAAKDVMADVQALVKAEVALAQAEVLDGVKAKAMGAGFFIGVAVIGWLLVQATLILIGLILDIWLPAWAAGLIVWFFFLLLPAAILGYLGYRKLQTPANADTAKQTVEESKAAAQEAVAQAQANTKAGIDEAKTTVTETAQDVVARVKARTGQGAPPTAPRSTVPTPTPTGSPTAAQTGSSATAQTGSPAATEEQS